MASGVVVKLLVGKAVVAGGVALVVRKNFVMDGVVVLAGDVTVVVITSDAVVVAVKVVAKAGDVVVVGHIVEVASAVVLMSLQRCNCNQ